MDIYLNTIAVVLKTLKGTRLVRLDSPLPGVPRGSEGAGCTRGLGSSFALEQTFGIFQFQQYLVDKEGTVFQAI